MNIIISHFGRSRFPKTSEWARVAFDFVEAPGQFGFIINVGFVFNVGGMEMASRFSSECPYNPEHLNTTKGHQMFCKLRTVFVLPKENNFCLCPRHLLSALNADELEKIMFGPN